MLTSLPNVFPYEGVCKGCLLGKHHQVPFKSGKEFQSKNLLELVHSDVFYFNIPSLASVRYILTFIDDLYGFRWV
jgi:hypothetical protein